MKKEESFLAKLENEQECDWRILRFLRITAGISVFFAGVVLLLGLVQLVTGVWQAAGINFEFKEAALPVCRRFGIHWSGYNPHQGISTLVSSLEFFLLAPLIYLQLRTLGDYFATYIEHDFLVERNKRKGSSEEIPRKKEEDLIAVKALSVGLLIAMLATSMVGEHLVSGEHQSNGQQFPWVKQLCGATLILVLTAYYFALEGKKQK